MPQCQLIRVFVPWVKRRRRPSSRLPSIKVIQGPRTRLRDTATETPERPTDTHVRTQMTY